MSSWWINKLKKGARKGTQKEGFRVKTIIIDVQFDTIVRGGSLIIGPRQNVDKISKNT